MAATKRRSSAAWVAVVVIGAVAAACTSSDDGGEPAPTSLATPTTVPDRGNVDGVFRLGVLLPSTGDAGVVGQSMLAAIDLAVADINTALGVNGRSVETVPVEESSDPEAARITVDQLLSNDGVDAIVGPLSSQVALAVLPRVTQARAAVCSPGNTAIVLEDFPDDGLYVRTIPTERLQAVGLAQLINREGYRSAAILAPDDDAGHALAEVLGKRLQADGTTVTGTIFYDLTDNAAGDVEEALATEPEALAVVASTDAGALILRRLVELGQPARRVPTFITDALRLSNLYERIDPSDPSITAGLRGTAPAPVPFTALEWVNGAFTPAHPDLSPNYTAYAYDCAIVLALAAQAAGTDDATVFKTELANVTRGGQPCRSYSNCRNLLREGRNIDYQGLSGDLEYTDEGEPSYGIFDAFIYGDVGGYFLDPTGGLIVTLG